MTYQTPETKNKSEHDLCRCTRRFDVFPVKCSIHAVRLLLDGHRELLERLNVKPTLPYDPSEFSGQAPLVLLTCEECDRLSAFPTSSYQSSQCLILSRDQFSSDQPVRPIRWI